MDHYSINGGGDSGCTPSNFSWTLYFVSFILFGIICFAVGVCTASVERISKILEHHLVQQQESQRQTTKPIMYQTTQYMTSPSTSLVPAQNVTQFNEKRIAEPTNGGAQYMTATTHHTNNVATATPTMRYQQSALPHQSFNYQKTQPIISTMIPQMRPPHQSLTSPSSSTTAINMTPVDSTHRQPFGVSTNSVDNDDVYDDDDDDDKSNLVEIDIASLRQLSKHRT